MVPPTASSTGLNGTRRLSQCTSLLLLVVMCLLSTTVNNQVSCQLPDDIQRELNQNLAEQARIQAMRARHQQQIQARTGAGSSGGHKSQQGAPQVQAHDPNNYSYQQISPPIQYSYYQPYGDAAQPQQPATGGGAQSSSGGSQAPPNINIDLNNFNFDLPTPQAQVAPQPNAGQSNTKRYSGPSFTGAGGLPVMQPIAAANQAPDAFAPAGQAPMAPQARVQQGPPLTEADFKDITGGENYGAPSGSDFGMGGMASPDSSSGRGSSAGTDTDAQLREFGMPADQPQPQQRQRSSANSMSLDIPDFGGLNTMGAPRPASRSGAGGGFDPFAAAGGFGGAPGQMEAGGAPASSGAGNDFDFASQPSSARGDQAQAVMNGAAPGSLQSLLGNTFPGLAGGQAGNMGLDGLARGNNAPESQLDTPNGQRRADDGAMDIADMGDKSDGFSGADLGGFEQPSPQNDQDFNYAAAAEHQPRTVPYPDGSPQLVGTMWALGQPQSLMQTRYNALPDKGTYQDYPAYNSGGNDFGAVAGVVDSTPQARGPAPGRYGQPALSELAPEYEPAPGEKYYDYSRGPTSAGHQGDPFD